VFAAAVILFMMVSAHQPFDTAEPKDPYYRCLAANRCDIFWRVHSKNKENGEAYYSNELKNLIQGMLSLDANQRPTIAEIAGHPWMQLPVPTEEEIINEFKDRQRIIQEAEEMAKQMKSQQKTMQ
jgi:serine/threonine protein kinase